MTESDKEHLQWIHDRLVHVYNENINVDFLIRLRKIIEESDYKTDMKYAEGYGDGWNNALKENGKPPHKVYEMIMENK